MQINPGTGLSTFIRPSPAPPLPIGCYICECFNSEVSGWSWLVTISSLWLHSWLQVMGHLKFLVPLALYMTSLCDDLVRPTSTTVTILWPSFQ